ncbi:hypothetical protein [Robiginitalea sp.]|uniref:hypothetical protein n=1 Tax=Robiginitalea sp. TaxID=1902411 RepID=UPI003C714C86
MKWIVFLFSSVLVVTGIAAQEDSRLDQLFSSFTTYSELPREVAYIHLNKSVFIKGEELGFKAYVMDKDTKKRSLETRNLYCIVTDSANRTLKSKMLLIEEGVGNGSFSLDSLFTTGTYTFRAYTNWMLNFSEPNYYEQTLEVIDPETDEYRPTADLGKFLDAQFLPEGGRAVAGLEAVYGVIIKYPSGHGVPNLKGSITDEAGQEITRFKVNQFGIGRFGLLLGKGKTYYARFENNEKEYRIPLPPAHPEGIALKLTDLKKDIGLSLEMVPGTGTPQDQPYQLSIHNGDEIKAFPISFAGDLKQLKVIPKTDLYKGMNIITLMDQNSRPLLERLYFNNNGLKFVETYQARSVIDSGQVLVTLEIPGVEAGTFNSLSLSVLPDNTGSYTHHHNFPSYTLLQPYLKGPIENAGYYFEDINARKRYDLDNLLITQGWSSYSWNTVLNHPPLYRFDFEKGISYTVRFNTRNSDDFYIYPTANNPSLMLKLKKGEVDFTVEEFYPQEGETLSISEISKKGGTRPPGGAVHFKPAGIPKYTPDFDISLPNRLEKNTTQIEFPPISFENLEKLQILDEVVVTKKKDATRMEKLKDRSNGQLDFFELDDPRRNQFLSNYLSGRGFIVSEALGQVSITARNPNSLNNATPIVYLDGILLTDFTLLYRFSLNAVDYIEINKSGIGSGIMGGGGVIKIFTDPRLQYAQGSGSLSFNEYEIPLTYGIQKRFYTPVYPSYNSPFFRKFGTVDWHPDVRADSDGQFRFQIKDYGLERIQVFVAGIVNSDTYALGSFSIMPGNNPANSQ